MLKNRKLKAEVMTVSIPAFAADWLTAEAQRLNVPKSRVIVNALIAAIQPELDEGITGDAMEYLHMIEAREARKNG